MSYEIWIIILGDFTGKLIVLLFALGLALHNTKMNNKTYANNLKF